MLLSHLLADRRDDGFKLILRCGAFDFMNENRLLAGLSINRKGCAPARAQRRMCLLGRQFDILRVIIASPDDNEILAAAGDIDLSVPEKAEIPRAEKWPLARIRKIGMKYLRGLRRTIPVSLRRTFSGQPNLPHPVLRTARHRLWIHDRHDGVAYWRAARDKRAHESIGRF